MKLSREVKTAIVAIIILALFVWGLNFLKGKNIIKPSEEYYVVYDNIQGIIESGTVFYKGYKVGNITGIVFDTEHPNKNFVVKFVLEKNLRIPIKSKVTASQSNPIVSTKDLVIEFYDTNAYYKPGDTLLAAYDPGIMGILEPLQNQFDMTIKKLNSTLTALDNTLNEDTQANIRNSVAAVHESLVLLRNKLAPNGEISNSLKNIESVTSTIKGNNGKINESIEHFKNISADLDSANLAQTLAKLDSTLSSTNAIIAKINSGQGTAGKLINDSILYNNLSKATASLDSLLTDIQAHPKRYVHVSVFGKKDK